jgi:hypothetical protein
MALEEEYEVDAGCARDWRRRGGMLGEDGAVGFGGVDEFVKVSSNEFSSCR